MSRDIDIFVVCNLSVRNDSQSMFETQEKIQPGSSNISSTTLLLLSVFEEHIPHMQLAQKKAPMWNWNQPFCAPDHGPRDQAEALPLFSLGGEHRWRGTQASVANSWPQSQMSPLPIRASGRAAWNISTICWGQLERGHVTACKRVGNLSRPWMAACGKI